MPKIASIAQNPDGSIQVNLENKSGVCFSSRASVAQAAQDARRRVGIEGFIALALIESYRTGVDVRDVELGAAIKMEFVR